MFALLTFGEPTSSTTAFAKRERKFVKLNFYLDEKTSGPGKLEKSLRVAQLLTTSGVARVLLHPKGSQQRIEDPVPPWAP